MELATEHPIFQAFRHQSRVASRLSFPPDSGLPHHHLAADSGRLALAPLRCWFSR